jgi:enoyl-CoA hydratase/carnithine racemase
MGGESMEALGIDLDWKLMRIIFRVSSSTRAIRILMRIQMDFTLFVAPPFPIPIIKSLAVTDTSFELLHTIMDFPFPTIALITGHTFGGACPFALSHDYRIMNSSKGFISMPPVNLGLHFDGIGTLPRMKLRPQIARKMLLEAHKWTGKEALADGVVDEIGEKGELDGMAIALAEKWAPKAKMGVYGVLRQELWGEASLAFRKISYVHHRETGRPAKAKI